jgi:hypothetical protein
VLLSFFLLRQMVGRERRSTYMLMGVADVECVFLACCTHPVSCFTPLHIHSSQRRGVFCSLTTLEFKKSVKSFVSNGRYILTSSSDVSTTTDFFRPSSSRNTFAVLPSESSFWTSRRSSPVGFLPSAAKALRFGCLSAESGTEGGQRVWKEGLEASAERSMM